MKRIINTGFDLPGATDLPMIARTPEGLAMGGIPGWKMLIDPAYPANGGQRNRALPQNVMTPTTLLTGADYGFFAGGSVPARVMTNSSSKALPSTFAMNPQAWSAFFVLNIIPVSATSSIELIRPVDTPAGSMAIGPRINIRSNVTAFAILGTDVANIRLNAANSVVSGQTALFMATSSTRDGLKIFKNGSLIAVDPTKVAPLDDQYGPGQFVVLRAKTGADTTMLAGMCGILDIDLGWPEHAGYRRKIEAFLKSKYSIV